MKTTGRGSLTVSSRRRAERCTAAPLTAGWLLPAADGAHAHSGPLSRGGRDPSGTGPADGSTFGAPRGTDDPAGLSFDRQRSIGWSPYRLGGMSDALSDDGRRAPHCHRLRPQRLFALVMRRAAARPGRSGTPCQRQRHPLPARGQELGDDGTRPARFASPPLATSPSDRAACAGRSAAGDRRSTRWTVPLPGPGFAARSR